MSDYDDYYLPDHHGYQIASQHFRLKWYRDTFFKGLAGKRILEIGCGSGGVIEYLSESNTCFGVDISESGIRAAKSKGLDVQLLDVNSTELPFPNEYFDFVLCVETIEHLSNPIFCIHEIHRSLNKNGKLIITIPNPRWGHEISFDDPSLFTHNRFKRFLGNQKFKVIDEKTWGVYMPFRNPILLFAMKNRYARWGLKKILLKLNPIKYSWTIVYLCIKTS